MTVRHVTIMFPLFMTLLASRSLITENFVNHNNAKAHHMEQDNKYIGMWVTADGYIRQELLPNGRYDEARGKKRSAYTGRYEITGTHIKYWDDAGFTATGDFKGNDTLYHGGYIFYREEKEGKEL